MHTTFPLSGVQYVRQSVKLIVALVRAYKQNGAHYSLINVHVLPVLPTSPSSCCMMSAQCGPMSVEGGCGEQIPGRCKTDRTARPRPRVVEAVSSCLHQMGGVSKEINEA